MLCRVHLNKLHTKYEDNLANVRITQTLRKSKIRE